MTADKAALPDLLPCPFCGWEPWLRETPWSDCNRCECTNPDCAGHADFKGEAEDAIAAWNRRVEIESLRSALAEKEAEIERLTAESKARRDMLMIKSEQLAAEWKRAEKA